MKVLVILAVVGTCVALPQGFLADTPEVQAEKQRFFQLYDAAAAAAAAAPDNNAITHQAFSAPTRDLQQTTRFSFQTGPTAPAPAPAHSFGQVQETPEVAAARQSFEAAFQQQLRATTPTRRTNTFSSSFHSSPRSAVPATPVHPRWNGPFAADIPAGLPGSATQVRNTPEVEAAIAEFTRTYNAAVVANLPTHARSFAPTHARSFAPTHARSFAPTHTHSFAPPQAAPVQHRFSSHQAPQPRAPAHAVWTGPFASNVPAGLPGSMAVGETADVASARAAFDRAFQQQLSAVSG